MRPAIAVVIVLAVVIMALAVRSIDGVMYWMGLPVGILFFGRAWSEPTLVRLAYAYEQASGHRRAPRLPLSLDLQNAI